MQGAHLSSPPANASRTSSWTPALQKALAQIRFAPRGSGSLSERLQPPGLAASGSGGVEVALSEPESREMRGKLSLPSGRGDP